MKIKNITSQSFRRYGRVIEHPHKRARDKDANLFHVVITERKRQGWRIAYLVVRDKSINRLEYHPGSFESFEPVFGETILYVSRSRNHNDIECFYLDRPVVLHKDIWHGVVTAGRESEIKITENAKVKCVYWPLGMELKAP